MKASLLRAGVTALTVLLTAGCTTASPPTPSSSIPVVTGSAATSTTWLRGAGIEVALPSSWVQVTSASMRDPAHAAEVAKVTGQAHLTVAQLASLVRHLDAFAVEYPATSGPATTVSVNSVDVAPTARATDLGRDLVTLGAVVDGTTTLVTALGEVHRIDYSMPPHGPHVGGCILIGSCRGRTFELSVSASSTQTAVEWATRLVQSLHAAP